MSDAPERLFVDLDMTDGPRAAYTHCGSWGNRVEYIRADIAAIPVKDGRAGWFVSSSSFSSLWWQPTRSMAVEVASQHTGKAAYMIECEAPND